MFSEKLIQREKAELVLNLVIGAVLLLAGIAVRAFSLWPGVNGKGMVGISLIPLAAALDRLLRINRIRKHPKSMSAVLIAENDERLEMERNRAEAGANRVLRWMLYLAFLGYTFVFPADAFEAAGWWILCGLFVLAYLLPCLFHIRSDDRGRMPEE